MGLVNIVDPENEGAAINRGKKVTGRKCQIVRYCYLPRGHFQFCRHLNNCLCRNYYLKLFFKLICFESEKAVRAGAGQKERERENPKQVHTVSTEPATGLGPTTP